MILAPKQRMLYSALVQTDERLARMYLGGLTILADGANPERLPLAAHAVRELMEKLSAATLAPAKSQRPSLTEKVRETHLAWRRAIKGSGCHSEGKWRGEIDGPLRKLLGKLEAFFAWVEADLPERRLQVARTLERLDASGRPLPPPLRDLSVDEWTMTHQYFQGVAHHGNESSPDEFGQWLDAAESFLLDRLKPRTFEDLDDLDALIREGEGQREP